MSIHKLTAGSGYNYLTRQVAALDATEKGHIGLAAYYTERGRRQMQAPSLRELLPQWRRSGLPPVVDLSPLTAHQSQLRPGKWCASPSSLSVAS
jgi:hypothetical protein